MFASRIITKPKISSIIPSPAKENQTEQHTNHHLQRNFTTNNQRNHISIVMYFTSILIAAFLATTSLATPTPDLETRYTKTRLTQYADNVW